MTVVSPRADSVAVTIYRDDLALVTETRTVDLPAAAVTLVVEDVVETLLPQSAIVAELQRPLAESNFDFDRLTPRSLLERSIGETVTMTRTIPRRAELREHRDDRLRWRRRGASNGRRRRSTLLLRVARAARAHAVPDELLAKPRLSIRLAAGEPGPRTVNVSYLAHGFAWSSDYVAHLNERSDAMSLAGWATLTNTTGTVFEQAEMQLVAGRLNILAAERAAARPSPSTPTRERVTSTLGSRLPSGSVERCRAAARLFRRDVPLKCRRGVLDRLEAGRPSGARVAMAGIAVTAARIEREEFGDYQLYRLPWRTDLNARQTKQVLFLDEPEVRIERFYGFRLDSLTDPPRDDVVIPSLTLRFENTKATGSASRCRAASCACSNPTAAATCSPAKPRSGTGPWGYPWSS